MPVVHLQTWIRAPIFRCFDLARDLDLHSHSAVQTRERIVSGTPSGLIGPGETVTFEGVHFGIRQRLTSKIVAFDPPYLFVDEMVQGAFKRLRHTHRFTEMEGGTLMEDLFDYTAPLGLIGRIADTLFLERYMRRFLERRNAYLKQVAEAAGEGPKRGGAPGQIIILNGTPRSGKSSIASVIQRTFEGVWMNLGVDRFIEMTPERYRPGIGLRPGGEAPALEPLVATLYSAMYESIAAHSRLGLNVVVDVGHHDAYSVSRGILPDCARRLDGLPVLFVGVHCPIEIIMERRRATGWPVPDDGSIPGPVALWQQAVHIPGIYDLEIDTSVLSPEESADLIRRHLQVGQPPSAFKDLAARR